MSEHIHQLAAAYALDAVSDEERQAFEAHLADCEACQEEVAGYHDTATLLGAAAAEPAPAGMRARVLDATEHTRQEPSLVVQPADTPQEPVSIDAARTRRRRRRGRLDLRSSGLAATAAAAAVVLVVAGGALVGQRLADEPGPGHTPAWLQQAQTASLSGAEGVTARFAYAPDANEGMLMVEGLAPLDRGVYQLWLFHDGQPVPGGVFTPGEDGTARVPANARVSGAELVAVTVEPPGGSSQPTSEPILAGEL